MKTAIRFLFWCILFVSLCLLFCLADGDISGGDMDTTLTVLTDNGCVSMPLEAYLLGALGAEMPASFETEALKAQTVAIRSYILAGTRHGDRTVCTDSTCCLGCKTTDELCDQWGVDAGLYLGKLRSAISETDGEYLVYNGEPAQAVFHASSVGHTESSAALWSDVPYLVSVDTPETAESVSELVTFSPAELSAALGLTGDTDPSDWIGTVTYEPSGRVQSMEVSGILFSASRLRSLLGLAGTDFDVTYDGTQFLFTVHGKGHGVGMSQTGANLLAAEGWDYRAILAHYYPGTELASLCRPAP